jgi:hypothetical protein
VRRLSPLTAEVALASAVTALAFPPTAYAVIADLWTTAGGVIPDYDLAFWSDLAVNLTAAELFGAVPHAKPISATAITSASSSTSEFTLAGHGLQTGDGPVQWTETGGALPGGVPALTDTWIIVVDANTFQIADSLEDALDGTFLTLTSNGSGTITFTGDVADQGNGLCSRLYWHSLGLLGNAQDGSIVLTAQRAYMTRVPHSARVVALGVIATFSIAHAISISVTPVVDSA